MKFPPLGTSGSCIQSQLIFSTSTALQFPETYHSFRGLHLSFYELTMSETVQSGYENNEGHP